MTKERNKYQKIVMDVLGTRPIAFNPDLAKVLGSVTASLFLCQLLYWWKKGSNPEMIWKTVEELKEETALSKSQQLHAQKICVRKGVLKMLYKGIPPKRHFQIQINNLVSLIESASVIKSPVSKRRETRHMNVINEDAHETDTTSFITETTFQETTNQKKRVATRRGDEDVTLTLENFHEHFANIPSTSKRL